MERLMRLREPAALVVLVGVALHLVVLLVSAVLSSAEWDLLAANVAYALVDPVLLLLLVALVFACWVGEPTPHARGLTIAALALTAVTLLGVATIGIISLVIGPPYVWSAYLFRAVSPLVVLVISVGVLISLLRRPQPGPAPVPELGSTEPETEPVEPERQPTWTPDEAVGTVWRRAGDAGSQRPATSWEASEATDSRWGPAPSADPPAEPIRRDGE